MIWFDEQFQKLMGQNGLQINDIFSITGDVFREPPDANRRTLRFERQGQGFFLKLHWGVGWREIFKNLFSLRWPVLGARNEWQAVQRLTALDVETMTLAGYGESGWNPAKQHSFVITQDLTDTISLEDYCIDWQRQPPSPPTKWLLIQRVAQMSRRMHNVGMNHRDLYLCHFLLQLPWEGEEDNLHLHLIDLHRVQIRSKVPYRWLVKDVGSLYFSSMDIGLTVRDQLRFIRHYTRQPLRHVLFQDATFWQDVVKRANQLYATRPLPDQGNKNE